MHVFIDDELYRNFGINTKGSETILVFNARPSQTPCLRRGEHQVRILFGSSNHARVGDAEWRGTVNVTEPDVYLVLPNTLDPVDDDPYRWTVQREGLAALYKTAFRGLTLCLFTDVDTCAVWAADGPFMLKTPIGSVNGSTMRGCLQGARTLATAFVERVSAWKADPSLETPARRSRWDMADDLE